MSLSAVVLPPIDRLRQPATVPPSSRKVQVTPPLKLRVVTVIQRHDELVQLPLPVLHDRSEHVLPLPTVTVGGGSGMVAPTGPATVLNRALERHDLPLERGALGAFGDGRTYPWQSEKRGRFERSRSSIRSISARVAFALSRTNGSFASLRRFR